tara:strand:+ start:4801 stop:5610 length:810 start_codon:yes stop_codon:yes gene_type:complete
MNRFGVVIPSFNQGNYISHTLESLWLNHELIEDVLILDNESTDGTLSIIEQFQKKWPTIRLISKKDNGQADALNRGFKEISGQYLCYLNSDDILCPNALMTIAPHFDNGAEFVTGHRLAISSRGLPLWRFPPIPTINDEFFITSGCHQESSFWTRTSYNKAGGFIDDSYRFAMDFELFVRMRTSGIKVKYINDLVGKFRIHDTSKTTNQLSTLGFQEIQRVRKAHGMKPMSNTEHKEAYFKTMKASLGFKRYCLYKTGGIVCKRVSKYL